ncbi:MAG: hypothetical protein IPO27_12895 [Bacteroidetes bacterium]|nr:hypothetical protein [Bacteroidota bacterium]
MSTNYYALNLFTIELFNSKFVSGKKLYIIITFLFIAIQHKYVASASYIWTQKASYPGNGWAYGSSFVLKGKGYYGTGQTNNIL